MLFGIGFLATSRIPRNCSTNYCAELHISGKLHTVFRIQFLFNIRRLDPVRPIVRCLLTL